ncbi:MAG: hypothetical protein QM756_39465 [Polyangiaceae bacterium]
MAVEQTNGTWYWLRPDREQVRGSLSELKALLAARALPRSTLVWTEPWPQWLAATEVAVLASVLPPSAQRLAREGVSSTSTADSVARRSELGKAKEPSKPEAAKAEPAKAEVAKAEPAKAEAKSEPKADVAKAEPAKSEPKADVAKAEPAKSEPKAEPAKKSEPKADVAKAEAKSEPKADVAKAEAKSEPKADAAKAEAKSEPKAEAAKAEVAKSEPKADVAKAEPAKSEPKADVAKAEAKSEPKADVAKAEPVKSEPKADVAKAEPAKSEPKAEPPRATPKADASGRRDKEKAPPAPSEQRHAASKAVNEPLRVAVAVTRTLGADEIGESASLQPAAVEPVESANPTESAKVEEAAKPVEPTKPSAVAKPVEPALPLVSERPSPRRPVTSSEAPVELGASEAAPPTTDFRSRGRRAKAALWVVSGACGALALALGLTLRSLRARPLTLAVEHSVAAPAPVAPKSPDCSLLLPAAKLAPNVERNVEPSVVSLEGDRAAIGFAASAGEAQGIVIDLTSFDVTRSFSEPGDARVSHVAYVAESPPRFDVQRDSLELRSMRALSSSPPLDLAVAKDALVARAGAEKSLLWALPAGHGAEPRAARLDDGSHRVVLRRGGAEGELVTGVIGADGRARGELESIQSGARLLGTPAIAAGKSSVMVVFAGRDQKTDPFRLRFSELRAGQPGVPASELAIVGDGNGAIAPSLTALGDEGWLLQWTSGEVGRYRVFVQALSATMSPLGTPVPVSPMGANAGQGVVRVIGERVLSLFVLPVPGHDELWGAVLKCP